MSVSPNLRWCETGVWGERSEMFGYSADIGQLRAATAELDTALSRAYDLVREIDSLAVPADSFGAIGGPVASTYTGLHQRKVAALDSVVLRLRDAGGMVAAVADMYQARDAATAGSLREVWGR